MRALLILFLSIIVHGQIAITPWVSPPNLNIKSYGAKGDGVTDDTAAIQAALNQVSLGGSMASQGLTIYFPQGTYKITNSLFYEGNVSRGVHFLGEHGATRGPVGARLWYQGPANGTLFFVLGANTTDFDHIDFDGGSLAKYIVRLDATNEYSSSTVWNISSISRTSNLVTVTTTAAHNLGSGDVVQIAGVTDTSYNGTYLVAATDSTTTFTFIQSGSATSSSGGTATRYKSSPSSGVTFHNCSLLGFKSLLLTPTSVARATNVTTFTFATPHFAVPGDTIYVTGMGDSTFNFSYNNLTQTHVATVPASTTFTISDGQANASTSGGTVLLESTGLSIAHAGSNTEQVSEVEVWGTLIQGLGSTQSMNNVRWNQGGNVKNFKMYGGVVSNCMFGFNGAGSGVFSVIGTIFGNMQLADFQQVSATAYINAVESEPTAGARWINNTGSSNNPNVMTVIGSSWQGTAAADDVVIQQSGNLFLFGNQIFNKRTGSSIPKINTGGQLGNGGFAGLVSDGNFYQHTSAAALPWQDGSGNVYFTSGSFHQNHSVSVVSSGDNGGDAGAMVLLPNFYGDMNKIFSGTPNVTGNVVPFGGFINMQSGDSIQFRNNTGNADVIGLSKDTSDVVQVGDTAGAKTVGPLSIGTATFATLPSSANGTTVYCSNCNSTCTAGSSTGRTCFRENGTWTH